MIVLKDNFNGIAWSLHVHSQMFTCEHEERNKEKKHFCGHVLGFQGGGISWTIFGRPLKNLSKS
jgi:hypothetical protein